MWGQIIGAILGVIPSVIKSIAEARRAKREQEARLKAAKLAEAERVKRIKQELAAERRELDENPY
jgi:hypothetical protein